MKSKKIRTAKNQYFFQECAEREEYERRKATGIGRNKNSSNRAAKNGT